MLPMLPLLMFYVGDAVGMKLLRTTGWSAFGWLPTVVLVLFGTPFCWRELRR